MNKLLLGALGIGAVGAVGWFILNSQNQATPTSTTTVPGATTSAEKAVTPAAAATVTFNGTSFTPATVTIKSGQSVAFRNSSTREIQVDSNPHPFHTDNAELNIGSIPPGEVVTATLTKVGTWRYHNHLNSDQGGTVVVQ